MQSSSPRPQLQSFIIQHSLPVLVVSAGVYNFTGFGWSLLKQARRGLGIIQNLKIITESFRIPDYEMLTGPPDRLSCRTTVCARRMV